MKCRDCGTTISGNLKWCPNCGARQITTDQAILIFFIAYFVSYFALALVLYLVGYSSELALIVRFSAPMIAGIIVLIIIFYGSRIEKGMRKSFAAKKKSTKR